MQNHLKDYIQFRTTVEGIELLALIDEYQDETRDGVAVTCASCQYVLCDGRDITLLVKDSVISIIEGNYLQDQYSYRDRMILNRHLDALESKQWNSMHS